MARPRKVVIPEIYKKFYREDSYQTIDGFTIAKGDIIKIKGKNSSGVSEWGETFRFDSFVTNLDTGVTWVECFEMFRGRAGAQRAFYADRVKRIATKRRKHVK